MRTRGIRAQQCYPEAPVTWSDDEQVEGDRLESLGISTALGPYNWMRAAVMGQWVNGKWVPWRRDDREPVGFLETPEGFWGDMPPWHDPQRDDADALGSMRRAMLGVDHGSRPPTVTWIDGTALRHGLEYEPPPAIRGDWEDAFRQQYQQEPYDPFHDERMDSVWRRRKKR